MRIGAHVSTSGGVPTAVGRAQEIGANCIQIFAGAPQRWAEARFPEEDVASFRRLTREKDIQPVFIHSAYLLNFASPDPALRAKSQQSLLGALQWARTLGAEGVIIHLGSSRDGDLREAENQVCESLSELLRKAPTEPLLLLESCAGQGNTIGRRFEQLGSILRRLGNDPRAQVCLDTAHIFEAGYDISTPEGLELTLEQFDQAVGIAHLRAFHINDSKTPLGSNVDRHENIGYGLIGEEAFARIMRHPALREVPFILEVPGMTNEGPDKPNIDTLRRLAGLADA
ncbi:MAG: deoxyribonuclease IV [Chloroflexota bacterium]